MTIADAFKDKDVQTAYIYYYTKIEEYDKPIFTGMAFYSHGNLMSLDGDNYDINTKIIDFKWIAEDAVNLYY